MDLNPKALRCRLLNLNLSCLNDLSLVRWSRKYYDEDTLQIYVYSAHASPCTCGRPGDLPQQNSQLLDLSASYISSSNSIEVFWLINYGGTNDPNSGWH